MNCYEHTLITRQDSPESENKKILDKEVKKLMKIDVLD